MFFSSYMCTNSLFSSCGFVPRSLVRQLHPFKDSSSILARLPSFPYRSNWRAKDKAAFIARNARTSHRRMYTPPPGDAPFSPAPSLVPPFFLLLTAAHSGEFFSLGEISSPLQTYKTPYGFPLRTGIFPFHALVRLLIPSPRPYLPFFF